MTMISVEKAIDYIENVECNPQEVKVSVSRKIIDTIFAEDVHSTYTLPLFNQSAMDGYAVCFGEELHFRILEEEVKAGDDRMISLKKGEAVRIFTGAPVPDTADAVIMQEKVTIKEGMLYVEGDYHKGQNIRYKGEEIQKGDKVFEAGEKITPATVGVLASLGISEVNVYRKPKIAIIVTGNELSSIHKELAYGEIYDSNTYTLGSFLEEQRIEHIHYYHVKDNLEETQKIISEALKAHDIVLITGGVSVGDYDFVKESLDHNGVEEVFYKIKQKPGKPLFFGKVENTFVFGLPGNPAAALTCSYVYVLPLIKRFKGQDSIHLKRLSGIAVNSYKKKGNRAHFLKAIFNDGKVEILDGQGSGMMHSFAKSNALVYMPESKMEIKREENVENIIMLY
ncbi:molybdopterin molybdotransferase [Flavobacteriaceae bacterium UJ101]|nr:molybdopterin molybdotransferase [Flavobacteriaceae bacterium UJ101]